MATATTSRVMTSDRYPGWQIAKIGRDSFIMTREGGIFAIGVGHSAERGWEGTLLSRQWGGWKPAKTPCTHCVAGCIAEATRREATIRRAANPGILRRRGSWL